TDTLNVNSIYGLYAMSALALFLTWIIIHSIYEGYRKSFHWRWAIILILSIISYVQFVWRTGTFNFMVEKATELLKSQQNAAEVQEKTAAPDTTGKSN
ncbi:MAG: hypothetical protein DWQ10_18560, partial [Calditrichaeota bacterium]